MAIGASRLIPNPPDVTVPICRIGLAEQRRPGAHGSASLRPQTDPAARGPAGELCQNDVGAGKPARTNAALAAGFRYRPFQGGLDQRRGGIDIAAVETQAGLEPQRVARAEPDRRDRRDRAAATRHSASTASAGMLNFEAVLAGVAGSRHQAGRAREFNRANVHEPHRRHRRSKVGERGFRFRTLQRDQRAVAQDLDEAGRRQAVAQIGLVGRLAGRVDDEHETIALAGHHQISSTPPRRW